MITLVIASLLFAVGLYAGCGVATIMVYVCGALAAKWHLGPAGPHILMGLFLLAVAGPMLGVASALSSPLSLFVRAIATGFSFAFVLIWILVAIGWLR